MQTIHNWTARRAGGRITITGVTRAAVPEGQHPKPEPVKVVGVDRIEARSPFPIAIDKNGQRWELSL